MEPNQFLAEFEYIFSETKGYQSLRELVLQLAVSGRLAQRDDEGDVAIELLEAKRLKAQYEADLNLRHTRSHPTLTENEFFYEIPNHWKWERLEHIACYIQRGKQPRYINSGTTLVVSQKCVQWTDIDLSVARYIDESSLNRYGAERFLQPGDLLWNSTGTGTVGRIAIYNAEKTIKAVVDSHVTIIRLSNFIPRYIWSVLASPWIQARIVSDNKDSIVTGTTKQVELATSSVKALAIPCPPIAEQKRVVAKVDELMALCDKLNSQQQDREALCEITRKVVLDALATAKSSEALAKAWNRVHNNFHLWLDNEDAVTELKDAVSFLGCCGFLTEPNPFYITESNIRKAPLPTGWSWKTLNQLAEYITSGSRGWKKYMVSQGDIFIRSQDIKYDALIFEDKVFVNLPEQVEGMRTLVRPGDLLMTITGANVGKCAQVPQLNQKAYVSQHVALIKIEKLRNTPFLHWWLTNSFGGRKHLAKYIYGDKPGLNLSQVRNIPIPLPPPEVQDRIVEALEHYKTLFDHLASQVKKAQNTAELLASAAVASITGIQIEDQEKMKVPKTELVSTLRIGVSPANSERAPLVAILIRNNGEMPAKTLWQASGLEVDAFYQQLKNEMARGWIVQPEVAYVREMEAS